VPNSVSGRDFARVNGPHTIDGNRQTGRRLSNNRAVIEDFCRSRIGHSVSAFVGMVKTKFGAMSLYAGRPGRKYLNDNKCLNDKERRRFLLATRTAPVKVRFLRRITACSRSRISEALALDEGVVIFETLKRRKRGIMRQVPLPPDLMRQLDKTLNLRAGQRDRMLADQRIWTWSRTTVWRYIKELMCRAGNCWTRGNAERIAARVRIGRAACRGRWSRPTS
jgi:hypothetical protein